MWRHQGMAGNPEQLAQADSSAHTGRSLASLKGWLVAGGRPNAATWRAMGLAVAAAVTLPSLATAQEAHSRLTLRIHSIKCIDESGGKYWERIGGDEIVLSGVAVDHRERARRIPTLRVGYFKRDGQVKNYSPPRTLATFSLTGTDSFPRELRSYLVLVERDEKGGFGPFIDKLVAKVNDGETPANGPKGTTTPLSTRELERILGAAAKGNPIFLKEMGETVWKKLGDDIFPPVAVERTIKSPTAIFPRRSTSTAPQRGVVKAHGGKYELVYSWQLHK